MTDPTGPRRIGRAAVIIALAAAFATLCGLPYLGWLDHPSLFHDDFMRAGSLRNSSLGEALFRPFNEHMAPLFETLSYLAWRAAGRDLTRLPVTFMVASYLGLAATVGTLAALVRRETGSATAAMVAVALFSLSSVSAETVLWYSACSFQWAAAGTLLSWYCAASAAGVGSPRARRAWLIGSALASMAAPAFSAIGILAAPLAGLRVLATGGRLWPTARSLALAAVPASGLGVYLLICAGFRYRQVLADSLGKNLDVGAAAWMTARAPAWVLLPSLVGLPDLSTVVPGVVAALATAALVVASLLASRRSRHRPLILGGLAMIAGGYLLAYGARARPGDVWIIKITRYHLFPQIGLVCLVVAGFGGWFRRLDGRPMRGLLAATLVAATLAPMQYRGMRLAAEGHYRFPDQARLLAAASRLEAVATDRGITFDQLLRTLDPIQPPWAPHPWPFHPILFLMRQEPSRVPRLADQDVRDAIIAGLSAEEREILFGGMEATRYRLSLPGPEGRDASATSRLVATFRVERIGAGRYQAPDGPACLEYQVDPSADEARSLSLPGLRSDWPIEVWWAGSSEPWSRGRSVRWNPDPPTLTGDSAVPIEVLPHWRKGTIRRLRIVAGGSGAIQMGDPRFLR